MPRITLTLNPIERAMLLEAWNQYVNRAEKHADSPLDKYLASVLDGLCEKLKASVGALDNPLD